MGVAEGSEEIGLSHMFNNLPIRILEEAYGKSLPSVLEEFTGVSAKTWKKGGPKRNAEIAKAKAGGRDTVSQRLRQYGGYSDQEVVEIFHSIDWDGQGLWLLLVRWSVSDKKLACPNTEELAKQLDELSCRLVAIQEAGDLPGFRSELMASGFYASGEEWLLSIEEGRRAIESAASAKDLQGVMPLASVIFWVALLQILSSWDVEFQSKFLTPEKSGRGLKPQPLFEMVMPRLKPGMSPNEDGSYPAHGLFHLPLRRLLDLTYCLSERYRSGRWPEGTPRAQIAASGGVVLMGEDYSEQPLAKLRHGLRGLTAEEFSSIWESMAGHDDNLCRHPPWPLYIVAQLWTALAIRKSEQRPSGGGTTMFVGFEAHYRNWWDRCLVEFQAKGTRFGDIPWPPYLLTA